MRGEPAGVVGETRALRQNGDMARPSVLTPERTREVEARLAGGASVKAAAEAIGVNPRTVGRWLAEGRIQRRSLRLVSEQAGQEPDRLKRVRLPHEKAADRTVPLCAHVEAVHRLLAPAYRLPFLWLDWSGARLGSVQSLRVGDYDEPARRVRLRASTQKTDTPLWVELHPALADAIEASLPPREDRDPEAPLFPGTSADRLRTAIARACKAAGVPTFSPHALRHRRVSLLHESGWSTARIAEFVGHDDLTTTLGVYTQVMGDRREADYAELLAA
jgi:integrase